MLNWLIILIRLTRCCLQGPFFEKILTKEFREQLESDGCFIRLLARSMSQCLYRTGDLIYKQDDIGSEVIIINITIYEGRKCK